LDEFADFVSYYLRVRAQAGRLPLFAMEKVIDIRHLRTADERAVAH